MARTRSDLRDVPGHASPRGLGSPTCLALCALVGLLAASRADAQTTPPHPETLRQIGVLMAEKASRTPAQRKLDSGLMLAMRSRRGDPMFDSLPGMRMTVEERDDGRTLVEVGGAITPGLLRRIQQLGGEVVSSHPEWQRLRAWMPLMQLEGLGAASGVRWIRPADPPYTRVASQGDVTHLAEAARQSFGVDGSGVKICALSDGIDALPAVQASGELPAVDVLAGQEGTGSEGAALLEIIHDLAPGAALGFATGGGGQAQFATNVTTLRFSMGCDVIVDDIGYITEPNFQDGPVAFAAELVVEDGAVFVASAGNGGGLGRPLSVWEGDFQGVPVAMPSGGVMLFNDFGGGSIMNPLRRDPRVIGLNWSDPFQAATSDYDLMLVDPITNDVVKASTNIQGSGARLAIEVISSDVDDDAGNQVLLALAGGPPGVVRVDALDSGVLTLGTRGHVSGHSGGASVISVGAACAGLDNAVFCSLGASPDQGFPTLAVEPFSSDGPRQIFFEADGTPLTPGDRSSSGGVLRQKPDVVGADGVTTTTPGFELFFGTSAGAPHVAAIAGLMLSANPNLTPAQVHLILTRSAADIGAPGVDPDSGAGIANALAAVDIARAGLPCADGADNDQDGFVDFPADPGCLNEISLTESPQCNDGIDNDGDGILDLADVDCDAPSDDTECGTGAEQALAIVPLMALIARRRRSRRSARTRS